MATSLDSQNFDKIMGNDKQYLDMILETEVINTGIGISKDKQKYLFVPFKELRS